MKTTDWFNIKLGLVLLFLCSAFDCGAKITLPKLLAT